MDTQELVERPDTKQSLDLTNGRDELNLAEFPLFALGQQPKDNSKTRRYEHTVHDPARNRTLKRSLEITGSDAYGLPTMRDGDVLMALLLLAKQTSNFTSPTIVFSRYQLVELLGWHQCGASYHRISEALIKWKTVSLLFKDGWWDREHDRWETNAFSLIDDVTFVDIRRSSRQHELPLCTVVLSQRFFKSLASGNIKRLNMAEWLSLQLPASKQMYRFLDKRFYHTKHLAFDLREFACEHVGLSRNYMASKIKAVLEPAISELVSIGFIEDAPAGRYKKTGRGQWQICFTRSNRTLIGDMPLKGTKIERVESRLLIKELTDRGMSAITARKLVEDASIPHDRIRQKIEILDWIMQADTIDPPARPAGWLRKAIEDDYQPPAGFESAEMRSAKRRRIDAARAKQEEDKARERQERHEQAEKYQRELKQVTDHLASLPEAEREALIDEALAGTNEFFRERAAKFRRNPSKKEGEGTYEMVLVNHILPRL